ncbi:endolytic transglycosylase MltG [Thermaurantiacus sp.]
MGRWLLAGAVALVAGALVLLLDLRRDWSRAAPPGAPTVEIEVPKGASLAEVARRLEAAGAIDSALRFRLAARLFGGPAPVRYGLYEIETGAGFGALLGKLQRGEVLLLRLVIPEGLPSVLVHERLMAAPRLEGVVEVPAEGSVLPATWAYRPGETRAAVLARMQKGMADTLAELWPKRSERSVVRTPEEAVILASIVEKETGLDAERRRVAGLYANRLRAGMRLEADPTVIYPITRGRPLGRRIRQSELRADTGYNTYVRTGLPKGPITNPGRASLEAVLDPEAHDHLFMVADGSGGHVFARDYAGHRANVARWYALRRERGEM